MLHAMARVNVMAWSVTLKVLSYKLYKLARLFVSFVMLHRGLLIDSGGLASFTLYQLCMQASVYSLAGAEESQCSSVQLVIL